MMDWPWPRNPPRLWVLKLMIDVLGSNLDAPAYPIYYTVSAHKLELFARGYRSNTTGKVVFLVNKLYHPTTVTHQGAAGCTMLVSSMETGWDPHNTIVITSDT